MKNVLILVALFFLFTPVFASDDIENNYENIEVENALEAQEVEYWLTLGKFSMPEKPDSIGIGNLGDPFGFGEGLLK